MALVILAAAGTFLGSGIVCVSLPFWMSRTETTSRQLWDLLVTFSCTGTALRCCVAIRVVHGAAGRASSAHDVRIVRDPSVTEIAMLVAGSAANVALGVWIFGRGVRRYSD